VEELVLLGGKKGTPCFSRFLSNARLLPAVNKGKPHRQCADTLDDKVGSVNGQSFPLDSLRVSIGSD
jgi:hypothetical protein